MSVSSKRLRRELSLWTVAAVVILGMFAFQVFESHTSAQKRVGITMMIEDEPVEIVGLEPGGPAENAGLEIGDIIVRIGERSIVKSHDYDLAARDFAAGQPVEIAIERDGRLAWRTLSPGMPTDYLPLAVNGSVILSCLLIGLLAISKRPGSMPSRLLCQLVFLVAAEVALPTLNIGAPTIAFLTNVLSYLLAGAETATDLHLISFIPQRRSWMERRPRIVWAFYILGLGMGGFIALTYGLEDVWKRDLLPWSYAQLETLYNWWLLSWATIIVVVLVTGIANYPRHRLAATLLLAGYAPWVIYIYVAEIMGEAMPLWVDSVWGLALLPFPLAIFGILRFEDRERNRVLRDLIHNVQEAGSMEKVSELIGRDLESAFHTQCNYVFFRGDRGSNLTTMYASGAHFQVDHIPSDYQILQIADEEAKILAYDNALRDRLPPEEQEWLDLLEANLIVPLIESDEHMAGLLILGSKLSEDIYTPDDLNLLRSLAQQITVAYENLHLQQKIQLRERVEREFLQKLDGEEFNLTQECPACGFCYDAKEEVCPRDGHKLTFNLAVERVIHQRYRLEQVLGRGGVAVVYLATDLSLNRGVAIKVLARSVLDDAHAPRRFDREAKLSAKLIHPHIVTTLDFGKTKNDLPYIVMEYLEGRTLRQAIKFQGTLEPTAAARWFGEILDGLEAAHELGVIHRDLKPDNVFLVGHMPLDAASGKVKLLDFGLAKIHTRRGSEENPMTTPGTIMGTLSYMAPEQLSGFDVDPRTDLYSVGVMAYESVTGRRPFIGRSPAQLLNAICGGTPVFLENTPDLVNLARVVRRAIAAERSERYKSAAELRAALIPALAACQGFTRIPAEESKTIRRPERIL